MKKILLVTLLSGLLLFTGCGSSNYEKITGSEAQTKVNNENAMLVDVRTPSEYQENHIEGAINLNSETIELTVEDKITDKNTTIILYCRTGRRSSEVARKLVKLGYKNVYDLGAIDNWSK